MQFHWMRKSGDLISTPRPVQSWGMWLRSWNVGGTGGASVRFLSNTIFSISVLFTDETSKTQHASETEVLSPARDGYVLHPLIFNHRLIPSSRHLLLPLDRLRILRICAMKKGAGEVIMLTVITNALFFFFFFLRQKLVINIQRPRFHNMSSDSWNWDTETTAKCKQQLMSLQCLRAAVHSMRGIMASCVPIHI